MYKASKINILSKLFGNFFRKYLEQTPQLWRKVIKYMNFGGGYAKLSLHLFFHRILVFCGARLLKNAQFYSNLGKAIIFTTGIH